MRISRRSWRVGLTLAVAMAAFVLQPAPATAVPGPGEPDECRDFWVIGARGSGQDYTGPFLMGRDVGLYASQVWGRLPTGRKAFESLDYPARDATLSTVMSGAYRDSVTVGTRNLRSDIRSLISVCRTTRIGLIGFSQGAQVVQQALKGLSTAEQSHIRAVLLLGNPIGRAGTGYRREFESDGTLVSGRTSGGLLVTDRTSLPVVVGSRTTEMCIVDDLVCDFNPVSPADLLRLARGDNPNHSQYDTCCPDSGRRVEMANLFSSRMLAGWTPPATPPPPPPGSRGTPPSTPPPGSSPPPPGSLTVKRNDYTRDGNSDLVAIRATDGCLARWNGTGTGSVTYSGDIGCGWRAYTQLTAAGDLNRDGVGDLVAIRKSDGCLARWRGTGTGGFTYYGDAGCGWGAYSELTGVGDINGDGVGDLVAIRKSDGCLARWKGTGTGSVTYIGDAGCGWGPYSELTGVGDINKDGHGDLVGIRRSDGCLAAWAGNGTGSVHYVGDIGCGWYPYANLAGMGDLNRDGVGDITAVRESDGCLARWLGTGTGGFTYRGITGCGWNAYHNHT